MIRKSNFKGCGTIMGQPLLGRRWPFLRAYYYIDDAKAYDIVENPVFSMAGVILGRIPKLWKTILLIYFMRQYLIFTTLQKGLRIL